MGPADTVAAAGRTTARRRIASPEAEKKPLMRARTRAMASSSTATRAEG